MTQETKTYRVVAWWKGDQACESTFDQPSREEAVKFLLKNSDAMTRFEVYEVISRLTKMDVTHQPAYSVPENFYICDVEDGDDE